MNKIINGKEVSDKIKLDIKNKIELIKQEGKRVPCLAVVIVGEDPASMIYVNSKEKLCTAVGMGSKLVRLKDTSTKQEVIDTIESLNNDDEVDGILLQLPLPNGLNGHEIICHIDPSKDVDGLHPYNVGLLHLDMDSFVPCTPFGVIRLLDEINYQYEGKNAVVIGRSNLVGQPIAKLLEQRNCTVTICHSRTKDLKSVCKKADLLIVAIGKPRFVNHEYVGLGSTVIDVGINRVDGKVVGDVDFDDVIDLVEYITPVPKGVGPMTLAMLLNNTMKAYDRRTNG